MNEALWIEQFALNLYLGQYSTNQLLNQMDPLVVLRLGKILRISIFSGISCQIIFEYETSLWWCRWWPRWIWCARYLVSFELPISTVSKKNYDQYQNHYLKNILSLSVRQCTSVLTISKRPKTSEVFSRKLVHFDAQLNIEVDWLQCSRKTMIQTFYHTACKSKFHYSNQNQLQYKGAEIEIH